MSTIKDKLAADLRRVVQEVTGQEITPKLEHPGNLEHGDYSSNVAMASFGKVSPPFAPIKSGLRRGKQGEWKTPVELAQEIKRRLEEKRIDYLEKVEVAGPGFLNFWLAKDVLVDSMIEFSRGEFHIPQKKRTKELIENTQPNTNKPLHIGHLRNTALGIALVNLRRTIGKNALSVNINNDRGIHIVKAMWAYLTFGKISKSQITNHKSQINSKIQNPEKDWKKLLKEWEKDKEVWLTPEKEGMKPDHFVGRFYVLGDKAEKEHGELVTSELSEMLKTWEEEHSQNTALIALWKQMNEWFYEGFRQTHARFLGIKPDDLQFDQDWYESQIYEEGKRMILDYFQKGVLFYKREDGAIVAKLGKYHLPDKVVLRADGTSVYITQDLELARQRLEEEKANLLVYVVGNEQALHFRQLFAICETLEIARKEQFLHIPYGMVYLKGGGRMSSREGTVIPADELMDEVKEKILQSFEGVDQQTAEVIAMGAIKYSMLRYSPLVNINFSFHESIDLQGNSAPYLQYTYVRTQSILRKANLESRKFEAISKDKLLEKEEMDILRHLVKFQDIVSESAQNFSPHSLCTYLFHLAQKFNLFYQKHKVLESSQKDFRLVLTPAVGETLKEGLRLLGIGAPERM